MACGDSVGAAAEPRPRRRRPMPPRLRPRCWRDDPRVALAAKIPGAEARGSARHAGAGHLRAGARRGCLLRLGRCAIRVRRRPVPDHRPRRFPQPVRVAAPASCGWRSSRRCRNRRCWSSARTRREAHHHRVHRRGLPVVPQAALADRRLQQAGHPRALPVLPAHRARTPSPGTRPRRCGARRTATTALTRAKDDEAHRHRSACPDRRWRATTSWGTSSA